METYRGQDGADKPDMSPCQASGAERLPDGEGQAVVFHAEPGSPPDTALRTADQPGDTGPMIENVAPWGSVIEAIRP